MKLRELAEALSLEVKTSNDGLDKDVTGAYSSDLLSDVMANAKEGNIWITLQTHLNIVAVASLKRVIGIIIVGNRMIPEEVLKKAGEEKITVMSTPLHAFELAGKVYKKLEESRE